ncbi:glycoside hydrolase family 57 protein [Oceanobacter sp. 4_MG-2023]|jgi:alpha-amylase/alpha-mannosidase (GH57 family)|uniref:glycoside hydrolase family 57 protein n=1 Tax=Oceanobacter sp. 4_MG-2023 TaxID=3062623 RepID=UPI00273642B3|nr:glycoside hydrolase family 57 protein [Oceanobacter sp. 4_MG-2023]MDP2547512.1 glycoside hydrolase family 57 protein [Oceanobacter sp. 4_MG-2023]
MQPNKIKLVICWHMHQPHYRDGLDGQYRLPWVYLHAIKDYSDMAAHLENNPAARVVVNFAPVLLEQLDDYAIQMRQWLADAQPTGDLLLNLVAGASPVTDDLAARLDILQSCSKAFAPTMIDRFPPFRKLLDMAQGDQITTIDDAHSLSYFNRDFFTDLLVWYHLAWMGHSLRLRDERVGQLINKGLAEEHFNHDDQRTLVSIMADILEDIVPRYRQLQDSGQIEISMTPYGHPIVPLLIDFNTTCDAMPDAALPEHPGYPGGYERARWHMQHGIEQFRHFFGRAPSGVWLSEGAVSSAAVGLLDEFDIRWTASGEGVWRHSCEASQLDIHDISSKRALYQPMRHNDQQCALFFRDDGMSDLIGFEYKSWDPQDAANNFAHNLDNIANHLGDQVDQHVVAVILDGENPWEYYPDNGYTFLETLYQTLTEHPRIAMTTFSDALDQNACVRDLPVLKAGSWVYGSFSTWIGDKDKNIGWDLLVEAKQVFDQVVASQQLSDDEQTIATHQLAVCEGSDWFWWFGDYNPADSVRDFTLLYQRHLEKLYQLLKQPIPDNLDRLQAGGGSHSNHSGTMIRN